MRMRFIGDVHGKFFEYKRLIKSFKCPSIQIGDMGIFFENITIPENHWFIRGNHDNPEECNKNLNFLGDFGFKKNVFFVSGADSIDRMYRIENVSWWRNEELTASQFNSAMKLYTLVKPKIMVSHDCPLSVCDTFFDKTWKPSFTRKGLQTLLDIHKPDYWIFGHHHKSKKGKIGNTMFICLNELEYCELDVEEDHGKII